MTDIPIGPEPSMMSNNEPVQEPDAAAIAQQPSGNAEKLLDLALTFENAKRLADYNPDIKELQSDFTFFEDECKLIAGALRHAAGATNARSPAAVAQETQDIDQGTLTRNLRGLAARMHYRVEVIEQRDGKGKGAIEGQGIGIGYLLAKDLADALSEAATYIEALCQFPAGCAPDVWNDGYQSKAIDLARQIQERRHANYAPSFQEKLLLADALMETVKSVEQQTEAKRRALKIADERAKEANELRQQVETSRQTAIEECAKIADDFASYEAIVIDRAHSDNALSETGRKSIVSAAGSRQVAAEQIAHDIRAIPSTDGQK